MESFDKYIRDHVTVAVDETVHLGTIDFRLVSNVPGFPALRFFSKTTRSSYRGEETSFELWCVSLKEAPLDRQYIRTHIDKTYRGKSFMDGYYATDHFGSPVYLVTHGHCFFVFGEQLERVVWPYFVKYFLMLRAVQDESLHLKGAACAMGDAGTLILGRGGTGKTVFLTQLCLHGAKFITNSHAVITKGWIKGIASSMRIRPMHWFSDLIAKIEGNIEEKPALISGEIIVDPYDIFEISAEEPVIIRNLCIIDFREPGCHIVKQLAKQDAYNYAEQFSLAINVYRLEEDLLDLYKNDLWKFSNVYDDMKIQLRELVERSRCYYISSDTLEKRYRDEIFDLLSR